jgi:hypothetical protein
LSQYLPKEIIVKTSKLLSILIAGLGIAFSASALADNTSKADYKAALKQADADYQTARAACPKDKGPDRTKCRRDAYAAQEKAKADAREAHGLPRHAEGPHGA